MPVYKTPKADLRRKYPLYMQVGLLLSLLLIIAAFTVPLPDGEGVEMIETEQEIIELEEIDPTQQIQPPPPPPPAPPPPQEVPDEVEIEEQIIEDMELDLTDSVPPPPAPPAAPTPPPTVDAPPPPPPEPEPTEPEIFEVAEVQPELIGGLPGLQERVEYPEFARRAGIEGQVVVQFVVDERGNVVDPVVLRSPNDLLSEAAVKAVQESRFTPGQQRGRPVKVRFAVPVTFRLR
ncbi:MAG: energy transducer TonB [Bacteroidota bacterium]